MRADMKSSRRGKQQLWCWFLRAAGPEAGTPLPSCGRQIEWSLEETWEREKNNRFHLNSLLSLILFELTANFACLCRPAPLSQKSPALPTSNPNCQPVEPAATRFLDRVVQNKNQSWSRDVGTPLSFSYNLWYKPQCFGCFCEITWAWRKAVSHKKKAKNAVIDIQVYTTNHSPFTLHICVINTLLLLWLMQDLSFHQVNLRTTTIQILISFSNNRD